MNEDIKLGDSGFQRKIEAKIIEKLESEGIYGIKDHVYSSQVPIGETKCSVDFVDPNKKIFCEIYTCGSKLKSAQKFKVRNDILKLIAIEKTAMRSIQKHLILTIYDDTVSSNEFYKDEKYSHILFGKKTWLQSVIELFEIKLFFYNLTKEEHEELLLTKDNQAKGNLVK